MARRSVKSPADYLVKLCRLSGDIGLAENSFRMLDQYLKMSVGHTLMTILKIDTSELFSERIYTSNPTLFSSNGKKALDAAPQMRKVIAAGRPLIVNGRDAIRASFPDYDLIFSLGCECIINVPLRWQGKTIANVNVLGPRCAYNSKNSAKIELACYLCLPVMLSSFPPTKEE
jgi:hypothetical protein